MPKLGAHISISGGVDNAPERAKNQDCEVMQIFVQNPQSYKTPKTLLKEAELFKLACKKYQIQEVYAHAPYLVNLASFDNRIRYGSISLIQRNLERASSLGCRYLMTHLGSYGESDKTEGQERTVKSLHKILADYTGKCQLLLELSAGSGHILGSRFEEIAQILKSLPKFKIGVCLDTAHIYESGYDLRGQKAIDQTLKKFDRIVGLPKLKLVHLNDSAAPFRSRKDRHADIGDGEISLNSLRAVLNHRALKNLNFILETPGNTRRRKRDIRALRRLS